MTYLYVWMVIAMAGTPYSQHKEFGWVSMGLYEGATACERAAANLNAKQFRCIHKVSGAVTSTAPGKDQP